MGYKSHLVAPFTEGMNKKYEPWLTPDEAFVELENAYIKRGILKERNGLAYFGQVGRLTTYSITASPDNTHRTGTVTNFPVIRNSLSITIGGKTVTDDYSGNSDPDKGALVGDVGTGTNTITYSTGVYDVTFDSDPGAGAATATYYYSDTGADRDVRGIHFFDKDLGANELLVADSKRLNTWDDTNKYFTNISEGTAVTNEVYEAAGHGASPGPFTHTAANLPVIPFTARVYDTVSGQYLYDNGDGNFIETQEGSVPSTATGTINYATGAMSVTFTSNVANADPVEFDYYHNATPVYDIWNSTNLQWKREWKSGVTDLAWLCDNTTNIYVYNGTYAIDITPRLKLGGEGSDTLTSARTMEIFQDRPIFFNTVEGGLRYSQRARHFAAGNPLTVDAARDDVDGYGDYNDAPTNDEIITTYQLKDRIVVIFERNIGFYVYTGNPAAPFGWIMLNTPFEANSTFGFWDFAKYGVTVGKHNLVACDGYEAIQANEKLPEFTYDIDYDNINKCYGFVIESKKQAWLAYPSNDNNGELDKVLVYNYEDNTISKYDFYTSANIETKCLSFYLHDSDVTYTDMNAAEYWPDIQKIIAARGTDAYYDDFKDYTYEELNAQQGEQIVVGGSTDGYVYQFDDEQSEDDDGNEYNFKIVSKDYNPYSEIGKNISLGMVDFLVSAIADCIIEVTFHLGFETGQTIVQTFDCESTSGRKVWKRVFCNSQAPVISFELRHVADGRSATLPFELHSHKIWFQEGGNTI